VKRHYEIFTIITILIFKKLFSITTATDLNIINMTLYSFYSDLVLFYENTWHDGIKYRYPVLLISIVNAIY
jgi:hypothetical protein